MSVRFSQMRNDAFLRQDRSPCTLLCLVSLFVLMNILAALPAMAQTRPAIQWMRGGHPLGLKQAVLSPNGKVLATIGYDATIKLRSTVDGTLTRTIVDANGELDAIVISPDGTKLISGATSNGPLHIYGISDGTLQQSGSNSGGVSALAWSPDGTKIAVGTSVTDVIQILNAADLSLVTTLSGHTAAVESVAFSPDGTHLVSGSIDKTVLVWTISSGTLLETLTGHTDTVNAVAFSSDNQTVASADADGTIKLWNGLGGTLLQTLTTNVSNTAVAFAPTGLVVATGSSDGETRLWNVATGLLLDGAILSPIACPIANVLYTPGGGQLLTVGQLLEFTYYNSADLAVVRSLPSEHTEAVTAIGVTPNGTSVVSVAENDAYLHVWNRNSGAVQLPIVNRPSNGITLHNYLAMAMSPDSTSFVTTDTSNILRVWHIANGRIPFEVNLSAQANAVAWSIDGKHLFNAISGSNGIQVRSATTGALVTTLLGHTDQILALAVSPDGNLLASASMDQTINIWNIATSSLVSTFTGHTDWVAALSFSPDSTKLLSGSYDFTAILWDVPTGKILQTLTSPAGAAVTGVAIAPDGQTMATASQTHLTLWKLASGSQLNDYTDEVNFTINPYTNASTMLTYSPDGANIIYSRLDATVATIINPYGTPTVTVALSPATVISGQPSTGTVTLAHSNLDSSTVVNLQCNNGIASLSTYSLTIPAGSTTANFGITTSQVAGKYAITITAGDGVSTAIATLNVLPHLPSDFNNDGMSDLVLQNLSTNLIVVWSTNVLNVLGASSVSYTPPAGWQVVGVADFNGDGNSDMMLQNQTTGQINLWYMIGTTVGGGQPLSIQPNTGYKVVGVADFNNDGHPDILFQNTTTGQLVIWYLNNQTVIGGFTIPQVPQPGWTAVGVADFNNDGKPDILFQNATTNQLSVWFMNGNQYISQSTASSVPSAGWKVRAIADINLDGRPDLVFQNTTTNQLLVWFMSGLTFIGGGPMSMTPPVPFQLMGPH